MGFAEGVSPIWPTTMFLAVESCPKVAGEGHGLDLVLVHKLDLVDVGILHNSGENCVVGEEVSPRRSQQQIRGVGGGKGHHGGRLLGNKLSESRHDEGDDDFWF